MLESIGQLLQFCLLLIVLSLQISILLLLFVDVFGLARVFLGQVLSSLQCLLVQTLNLESSILRFAPVLNVVNVLAHVGQLREFAHGQLASCLLNDLVERLLVLAQILL